jgi:hypothetical protein
MPRERISAGATAVPQHPAPVATASRCPGGWLTAARGKVFTLKTLDWLVDCTALRSFRTKPG